MVKALQGAAVIESDCKTIEMQQQKQSQKESQN
jgi:hypothetical protein